MNSFHLNMSGIIAKPFRAYIPPKELVSDVIAPPYDVLSREEAAKMGQEKPKSVIHISRPEIAFPGIDETDEKVYEKGAELLRKWIDEENLVREKKPGFYVCRSRLGDHVQVGVYGLFSCEQYEKGLIRKHEQTREKPEKDRTKTVRIQNANVGSVFLAFRGNHHEELRDYIKSLAAGEPDRKAHLDFDHTEHELWIIDNEEQIEKLQQLFGGVQHMYIADGHHRAAAACNVWKERKEEAEKNGTYTGTEPFCYFLACAFADSELCVIDYNRVVSQNSLTNEELFKKLEEQGFTITPLTGEEQVECRDFLEPHYARPLGHKVFSMYVRGKWYRLQFNGKGITDSHADNIDSKILTDFVLTPLFGIKDLRSDPRMKYLGGTRGLKGLEESATADHAIAFACPPVEMSQLLDVSDEGNMMPPKSTWFVPKLADAMVIRLIESDED